MQSICAPPPRPSTPHPTDSDPHPDELLRRARQTRGNLTACPNCDEPWTPGHQCPDNVPGEALRRLEIELAYTLRDRQPIDAYRQWAQGTAA